MKSLLLTIKVYKSKITEIDTGMKFKGVLTSFPRHSPTGLDVETCIFFTCFSQVLRSPDYMISFKS